MAKERLGSVLHYIRQITTASAGKELTDRELLESFAVGRDEAAFGTLMQRHGALVWGVCQRVLQQAQDAEDAFQATFLVLARKASRVRWQHDIGNWLYAVAFRTALKAKAGAIRRNRRERQLQDMPAAEVNADSTWQEIRPVLDEELNRLPLKYRAPVILHYFEGKTYTQAAEALGWPAGTVATRLAQARDLLRGRLARRGFALTGGLLATALSQNAASAMAPAALVDSTLRAAVLLAGFGWHAFAASSTASLTATSLGRESMAPTISTKVATLTEGVLKAMFLSKLKMGAVLALALGVVGAGVGAVGYRMLPGGTGVSPVDRRDAGPTGQALAQAAAADQPDEDKPKQEIERLRKENEELRRELRVLKDKINEIERKTGPAVGSIEPVLYEGKSAEYWLKMLKDRSQGFRIRALEALGAIGVEDKSVIPAILECLKDKQVGYSAGKALAGIGKDGVAALISSLKAKDREACANSMVALQQMGPEGKDAVPALIELLEEKDEGLRRGAAFTLGKMAPASRSAIPALIKLLQDDEVRGASVNALISFGELAIPTLSKALKDRNARIRNAAAVSLSLIGKAKMAVPALILAVADENRYISQNAEGALVQLGADAVPALAEGLKDQDPAIRATCAEILGKIGHPNASPALPALTKALADDNESVRKAAAKAYKRFPTQGRADP